MTTRPVRFAAEPFDEPAPAAHLVTMQVRFPGRRIVTVHAFPSADQQFGGDVSRALDDARARTTDPEAARLTVVSTLRQAYPSIRLVPQDELAGLLPGSEVWYAYRDGAVRPTISARDRSSRVLGVVRRRMVATVAARDPVDEVSDDAGDRSSPRDTPFHVEPDRAEERS